MATKGKGFYHRLVTQKYLSLTGMKGSDTMFCVAVYVREKVEESGNE